MRAKDPAPKQEDTVGKDLTGYLSQLVPAPSEAIYERLVGYGFARRYVSGKTVANVCWEEVGHGSRLLAGTAGSIAGITRSAEAMEVASAAYSAPNLSYERIDFPKLPYPEEHFDVVVALGVIENLNQPGDLVREARRVLKRDGLLVVSVPDKTGHIKSNSRYRPGMYASEFQELLEGHFEHVRTYRQGAVAGGAIFPDSGEVRDAFVESGSLSPFDARPGEEPPALRSIVAVCAGVETFEHDERAYLLLDRDRRVFEAREDLAEDVDLLRDEIQRMQDTEVQVFRDALRLRVSEIAYLRAQIRRLKRSEAQIETLKAHIRNMENSTTWRMFEPYRRLRARLDARKKPAAENARGSEDQPG